MEKEIIIIGAGLTGLTLGYYLKKAGKDILIIEKENRTGGVIHSVSDHGFTYETGPSTGVINTLEIAELFEDLKNKCTLEIADNSAQKRYILKNNQWQALPSGFVSAVRTPLFSLKDKFRILGEPFRKPGTNPDENVADLVKRRLGKTFLDYAIDPFISGVYAGDPQKLVTRFALPKLYNLEQKYGSFIKGAIKKQKEPKEPSDYKITKDVFSVKGGLGNLIKALTEEIGAENILTGCNEVVINPLNEKYAVTFNTQSMQKTELIASKIVTTIGGHSLPALLPFVPNEAIKPLKNMSYAGVVQVAVGFRKWDAAPPDAFGGLVPTLEKKDILGILYPSAMFKDRCPATGALLSVFMGGSKKPDFIYKSDEEIENIVINEIRSLQKVNIKPELLRIHRYTHAIAQYDITSQNRLDAIEKIEKTFRGLILAGSIRDGIGMADRVKQAKQLVKLLSEQ